MPATQSADPPITDFTYDAFISYRRAQGWRVAQWLSGKLARYRPPKDLLRQLPPMVRERLERSPHPVFLDTRFERSNSDFWKEHIIPALTSSRRLIVISTADAFEPRRDGSPNWVEQEIEVYWERFQDPGRIFVALAPNAPQSRYPGKLDQISRDWDWADLRDYRRLYWLIPWGRAQRLENAIAKLIGGIYDIPTELLPILRQEERRRRNRWRMGIAALVAVVIGLSTFGTWQLHQRSIEQAATNIWNGLVLTDEPLRSHEIDQLWKLATIEDPAVFEAFWSQVPRNPSHIRKLGLQPELLTRTIGFGNSQKAQAAIEPLLVTFKASTEPDHLHTLAKVLGTLPVQLAPEQGHAVAEPLLKALRTSTVPDDHLNLLIEGLAALPVHLAPEQTHAAAEPLLTGLQTSNDPGQLRRLEEGLRTLAPKLPPEQAYAAIERLLQALKTSTEPFQRSTLAEAVGELTSRLPREKAHAAIEPLLTGLQTSTNSDHLRTVEEALGTLIPKLPPERAYSAAEPLIQSLQTSNDHSKRRALVEALLSLAPKLSTEQARAVIAPLLKVLKSSTDFTERRALARVLAALPTQLTPEEAHAAIEPLFSTSTRRGQRRTLDGDLGGLASKLPPEVAQAVIGPLFQAFKSSATLYNRSTLAEDLAGLSVRLTSDQVRTIVDLLLQTLNASTNPRERLMYAGSVSRVIGELAPRLPPEQVRAVVHLLLQPLKTSNGPSQYRMFYDALRALAPKLSPEQARAATEPLLQSFNANTDPFKRLTVTRVLAELPVQLLPEQARPTIEPLLKSLQVDSAEFDLHLAEALQTLAPKLPSEQAHSTMEPLFQAFKTNTEPDQQLTLAKALAGLPVQLPAEKVGAVIDLLLQAIQNSTLPDQRRTLVEALGELVIELPAEQDAKALVLIRTNLAKAASDDEAEQWGKVIVNMLQRRSHEEHVAETIEVLKYPTAAREKATDVLLEGLRTRFSDAPSAGLRETVAWMKERFHLNEVKLSSPPVRPNDPAWPKDLDTSP